jgi:hypothetical protein
MLPEGLHQNLPFHTKYFIYSPPACPVKSESHFSGATLEAQRAQRENSFFLAGEIPAIKKVLYLRC